jgi:hypothetical protein
MDKLKEIFTYFLAAMAMLSLLCAVYEAMNQRLASAGVLGGIFLAAAFLIYLPQLETFRAFGVEARMQKNLDRAQEILDKVRQVSIASAKSAYLSFAWSGRLGGMPERDKQKVLDSVHDQLRDIGVSNDDLRAIEAPHIQLIGYDLSVLFYHAVRGAMRHARAPEKSIEDWDIKWTPSGLESVLPSLADGRRLTTYLKQQIPLSIISAPEVGTFEGLANKIGELYEGCLDRGGYTEGALRFVDLFREHSGAVPDSYYELVTAEPPAWK